MVLVTGHKVVSYVSSSLYCNIVVIRNKYLKVPAPGLREFLVKIPAFNINQ